MRPDSPERPRPFSVDDSTAKEVERWLRRRGLPQLTRGTIVGHDVTVRAAPVLIVLYAVMMIVLIPTFTPATWSSGLIVSIIVMLVTWVVSNLFRRRAPFSAPNTIGPLEALAFVATPVLSVSMNPPLLLKDERPEEALQIMLGILLVLAALQIVQLVVVFFTVLFGVVTLSRWLIHELANALANGASALASTLPVVLGVVFFFFLNPGIWVTIGRQTAWAYTGVISLLLLLTGAFIGSRSPLDMKAIGRFEDADQLGEALVGTPLEGKGPQLDEPTSCPLGRWESGNLKLIVVISRLMPAVVIALGVFAFFGVLGYLAVDTDTVRGWTRQPPSIFFEFTTAKHTYILSAEHARVAGFVATFAAFNYSLASATDSRLRHSINDTAEDMARSACALRVALLASVTPSTVAAPATPAKVATAPTSRTSPAPRTAAATTAPASPTPTPDRPLPDGKTRAATRAEARSQSRQESRLSRRLRRNSPPADSAPTPTATTPETAQTASRRPAAAVAATAGAVAGVAAAVGAAAATASPRRGERPPTAPPAAPESPAAPISAALPEVARTPATPAGEPVDPVAQEWSEGNPWATPEEQYSPATGAPEATSPENDLVQQWQDHAEAWGPDDTTSEADNLLWENSDDPSWSDQVSQEWSDPDEEWEDTSTQAWAFDVSQDWDEPEETSVQVDVRTGTTIPVANTGSLINSYDTVPSPTTSEPFVVAEPPAISDVPEPFIVATPPSAPAPFVVDPPAATPEPFVVAEPPAVAAPLALSESLPVSESLALPEPRIMLEEPQTAGSGVIPAVRPGRHAAPTTPEMAEDTTGISMIPQPETPRAPGTPFLSPSSSGMP
ncbi:hypothetical protein, partial [Austwickia sp. TVS 96-490-7B]|uniref:hypothetical protein n=1 Tax=Austwickia sp. TVS 96-490-7B TaxID=2830843 RepID=UPI0021046DA3